MSYQLVTEWAKEQVGELAMTASKTDDWLEPVVEPGDPKEYDEFERYHRDRWEETVHWSILYGLKIKALADTQQDREEDGFEVWLAAYTELKDVFWEAWEREVKLYEFWTAAQKARVTCQTTA